MAKNEWFTFPASDDDGRTVIVTGRLDVEKYRSRERNSIRVEVTLPYTPEGELGFPGEKDAELLEKITEAFEEALKGKNTALLTGIYTGSGERNWVFYTLSTHIFGRKLNEVLEPLPVLPLSISAENDPGWEAYDEMADAEIHLD